MSNPKPKWAQVRPINLEFNINERLKPSTIVSWDLKEKITDQATREVESEKLTVSESNIRAVVRETLLNHYGAFSNF